MITVNYLWLIPLFPFIGAAINGLGGHWLQQKYGKSLIHYIAVGAMALSTIVAWYGFLADLLPADPANRYLYDHVFDMIVLEGWDLKLEMAFAMDPLSAVMALIISTIGTAIHIYSVGYMHDEKAYWRFFSYLNLFCFAMFLLVLGDNFLVMFFGWEGVGLCSYLLIGFWYTDIVKAKSGMKAFVANRFGDFGFVLGLFLLFWALGGAVFTDASDPWPGPNYGKVIEATVPVKVDDAHAPAGDHAPASGHGTAAEHGGEHGVAPTFDLIPKAHAAEGTASPDLEATAGHGTAAAAPTGFSALPPATDEAFGPGAGPTLHPDGSTEITEEVTLKPTINFRELRFILAAQVEDPNSPGFMRPFGEVLRNKKVLGVGLVFLICLLFFIGATGKSAQIPLFVWLPDAMAGPTPVSALIHAATMVTAGVYMIARLNFLFALSPSAMTVVAVTGAATALFAATIGFFQHDIKKVLAYSTISQLGFMFIGVGVGGYWAGVYHLLTHACFKACLFLGSGSVIHAMHPVVHDDDEAQDMRNMGGLKKFMPHTSRTYLIACLAIAGIPIANGFYSKDEILWKAFASEHLSLAGIPFPGWIIWAIGALAAVGTAFYMFRSYFMTFEGKYRGRQAAERIRAAHAEHGHSDDHGDGHGEIPDPHESPASMTYVLWFLAVASIVTVGLGFWAPIGIHPLMETWLEPVLASSAVYTRFMHSAAVEFTLIGIAIAGAFAGIYVAYALYYRPSKTPQRLQQRYKKIWQLVYDKYRVDELYEATILGGSRALARGIGRFDNVVIDGMVNGVGTLTRFVGWVDGVVDKYVVDGAVNGVAWLVLTAGRRVRSMQTGRIQHYAAGAALGIVVLYLLVFTLAK